MCAAAPDLRDEVYFQLLKQTLKNDNESVRARTWDLLLIVATAIPASAAAEHEIKSHIAAHVAAGGPVAGIARFVFVRFAARCAEGVPLAPVPPGLLASLPRDPYESTVVFGASVYEQLLTQKRRYPRLPIPFVVPVLARVLVDRGALAWEGVFRRCGELGVVSRIVGAINEGRDIAETVAATPDCRMNELAQIFKLWFSRLPERLVSGEHCALLRKVFQTTKDYLGLVHQLPLAHQYTLKFLIGFLQQIAKAETVTRMSPDNIGIVFGQALVTPSTSDDPLAVQSQISLTTEFTSALLEQWDTSDIYPVPEALFRP
jgi:hypothetical protein